MPCCLTLLTYGCRHKKLWKVHCTAGCSSLPCPPERQEMLARLRYRWNCEDCHNLDWDRREQARADAAEANWQRVMADETYRPHNALVASSAHARNGWLDRAAERQRCAGVDEIQVAGDYAEEYGLLMWRLKYGRRSGLGAAYERLDFLRLMETGADVRVASNVLEDGEVVVRLRRMSLDSSVGASEEEDDEEEEDAESVFDEAEDEDEEFALPPGSPLSPLSDLDYEEGRESGEKGGVGRTEQGRPSVGEDGEDVEMSEDVEEPMELDA